MPVVYRRKFDENDCSAAVECLSLVWRQRLLAAGASRTCVTQQRGARHRNKLGELDFIMPVLPRLGFPGSRTPASGGKFLLACFSPGFPECIATSCLPRLVGAAVRSLALQNDAADG